MKLNKTIIILLLAFLGCSETTKIDVDICNECVVIDNDLYNNTDTNNYSINDVVVTNNLLTIKISAGGCSVDNWSATLIDADQILESNPVQRNIKILFTAKEDCLAFFEKEFTFNIRGLKENYPEIILNLEGWNTQINY